MTVELIASPPTQTSELERNRSLLGGAFVTYGGVIALHRIVDNETVLREPDERFEAGAVGYRGVQAVIDGELTAGMKGWVMQRFPEEKGNVLVAHRSQLLGLRDTLSPQLGGPVSFNASPLELLTSFCRSAYVYDQRGGASGVTYDACISYLANPEREELEVQYATRAGNLGSFCLAYQTPQ